MDSESQLMPNLKIFADDIKAYQVVSSVPEALNLQSSMSIVFVWCKLNQLKLNIKKCCVLHIGDNNLCFKYTINGEFLDSPTLVKDLCIHVDRKLTFHQHISKITAKASSRCGLFLRTFIGRDPVLMRIFFTIYVRPLLEYGSTVWSPRLLHQLEISKKIEGVQRFFSKKMKGLEAMTYMNRLLKLRLNSLQHRRTFIHGVYV